MAKAYSVDLRKKVIDFLEKNNNDIKLAVTTFTSRPAKYIKFLLFIASRFRDLLLLAPKSRQKCALRQGFDPKNPFKMYDYPNSLRSNNG